MSQRISDDKELAHMAFPEDDQALQATPDIPAVVDLHEQGKLAHYSKMALKIGGIAAAFLLPAAAVGVEAAAHSTTHVPMHIAGSDVTVTPRPGSNLLNIDTLGLQFSSYSHRHIGQKDLGFDINVDTANSASDSSNNIGTGLTVDGQTIPQIFEQFTDFKAQQDEVTEAVKEHSRSQFLLFGGGALAVEVCLVGAAGGVVWRSKRISDNEQEIAGAQKLVRSFKRPAIGAAAVLAAAPNVYLGYSYVSPNHPGSITADPALDCTSLKGWQVSGLLKQPVVDTTVPNVCKFLTNTETYYANAASNLKKSFVAEYGTDSLPKQPGVYRVIFGDDLQGIPMGQLFGLAAHMYNADVIDAGGDINQTGSSAETDVADTLYDSAKGIPVIWVRGHHDDLNTVNIMKEHKFIQADGTIQKVGPLTFFGVNDAETIDGLGLRAHEITPGVDNAKLTQKAINYLCSDAVQKLPRKPVFISHDRAIGDKVAASGCVPAVLTGREYFEQQAINYSDVDTEIISGSSGGHVPKEGFHVFGSPKSDAVFHLVDFDAKTQRILDYRVVTVSSDIKANVTFGPVIKPSDLPLKPLDPQYRSGLQAKAAKAHREFEASRSQFRHRGTSRPSKTR